METMINGCDFAEYWDNTWYDILADRHNQGVNLSFLDGHVEFHRWGFPKAGQQIGHPAACSNDLNDLRWLQEKLPSP
jgi:prepilin-type processing-associated H-X9-DG protein